MYDMSWRYGTLLAGMANGAVKCWQLDSAERSPAPVTLSHGGPVLSAPAPPGTPFADRRVLGVRALGATAARIASVTAASVAVWDLARPSEPLALVTVWTGAIGSTAGATRRRCVCAQTALATRSAMWRGREGTRRATLSCAAWT